MTQQITDQLIFENKEYYLNVELLEDYFREFPEKKPEFKISCTALWRGHIAIFEIKNTELLIKEINWLTDVDFNMKSLKDEIFPDNKFEWYSGLIRIDDFKGEFDKEPENGIFESKTEILFKKEFLIMRNYRNLKKNNTNIFYCQMK